MHRCLLVTAPLLVTSALGACERLVPYRNRSIGTDAADVRYADGPTGVVDASDAGDAPPSPCPYGTGSWIFGAPEPVSELNSPGWEGDLQLAADGLSVVFASVRPGSKREDLYFASRTSLEDPFGAPGPLDLLNTPQADLAFHSAANELLAVLVSDRPGAGTATAKLWLGERASAAEPWSSAQFQPLSRLNSAAEHFDAVLSPDGLRLYYSPAEVIDGPQRLVVAERPDAASDFGSARPLVELDSPGSNADPAVSSDERVIIWTSGRNAQNADLWFATRPNRDAAFSAPRPLDAINSESHDGEPFLSADGCTLYFSSQRGGPTATGDPNSEFYRVAVSRGP